MEEKIREGFCQTLNGQVGGYSYVTDPTPNTFTSNVPVKLNKDTYLHATKVNLILYFVVAEKEGRLAVLKRFHFGVLHRAAD